MSASPRLLIYPFNLMAHYLRSLEFAHRCPAHYDIRVAHSELYGDWINYYNFSSFPAHHFDPEQVMQCVENFNFNWLNFPTLNRLYQDKVHQLQQQAPDLVIGDMAPTLKMAAETVGIPYISLINGYMSPYYRYPRTLPHHHPAQQYKAHLPTPLFQKINAIAEQGVMRYIHRPFFQLRQENSLSLQPNSYLHELTGDHTFICDLPPVFPQASPPDTVTYLGPLYYSGQQSEQHLLQTLDHQKPKILVCMGSSGNWEKVNCLTSPLFNDYNIITAGDVNRQLQAPHILQRDFLNNNALLPYCDCMICHGGNGTIYQGIYHRTPLICIPSHFEQEWNIDFFAEHYPISPLFHPNAQQLKAAMDHYITHPPPPGPLPSRMREYNPPAQSKQINYTLQQLK